MTNSNTSHTQKILLTTLTLLFLTGFSAATQSISDGDVGDLDTELGTQTQSITFTLQDGTDYDGDSSGEATVDIDVTTADSSLTVSSATLDTLSGSDAGDISSAGTNGVSVSSNTVTLKVDESTLTSSDSTVDVTITLDDIDASSASTGSVSYDVVSNGDGGGTASGETVTAPFSINQASITFDSADLTNNDDVQVSPTATNVKGGVFVEITEADSSTVVGSATLNTVDGTQQTINLDSPGEVSDGETMTATMYSSNGGTQLGTDTATASQTQSISGTVYESDGSTKVSSGTVQLYEGQTDTSGTATSTVDLSSNSGTYSFSDVAEGDVTIAVKGVTNHEDDSTTFNLNAGEARTAEDFTLQQSATFDVTINDANTDDTVDQSGELTVEAEITNNGDVSGTKDVSLEFPDGNSVSTKSVESLGSGSTVTETFTVSGTGTEVASGSQTAKVVTPDDSVTTSVTVNQVLDSYSVSATTDPINQGEALQLDITSAQDKAGSEFTGTADLTIDNVDGQDPLTNSVDFTSGSATGVEILSASNTESVSSGDYTDLTVSAQDASDTFGVTVNPVLDSLEVDQDSVEVGQNSALTVDLSNAKDLAGDDFTKSATVNFDTSNFAGTGDSASTSASPTFDENGDAAGVTVLDSSGTQIQAESEVTVNAGTSLTDGDSFTANITQVAETISAASNTTADSDEAVADGSDEVKFTSTVTDYADNPVEGATVSVDDAQDVGSLSGISAGDSSDTDSNGEATFTATSTNKGNYLVQFSTTSGDATQTPTATGHFKAGATDYLEITTTPSASTAGSDSGAFVVTRYDANDNAVTSGSLTVDLSTDSSGQNAEFRDSGSSSLSGTVEFTDGSSTASFYYYDEDAGDHSLTANATDITGDSVSHKVEVADANSVAVETEPVGSEDSATAGEEIGPTRAKVTDEFGNAVEGVDVEVSETGNSYAFDSGTTTQTTDENGVATFDDLNITTANTGYQLEFSIDSSDGDVASTSSVTTGTFEVVAASVDSVEINDGDQTIASDGTYDFSATAKDEFGNVIEDSDQSAFAWTPESEMDGSGTFESGAEAGTYDVTASYTDTRGEDDVTVESSPVTVTVGDDTYDLTADQWTALSAPYMTSSVDLQGSDGTILSYDPSAEGDVKWNVVSEDNVFQNPQKAYFVKGFDSVAMNKDSDAADVGVTVEEGWNFVGAYNNDVSQQIRDVFSPFENAADTVGYPSRNLNSNGAFTGFKNFDGSSTQATEVNQAYWFHVYDGPATLTPPQPETN